VLDGFAYALGSFQVAPFLDAMEAADDLRRLDGLDGPLTDPREDVDLQMPDDLLGVAIRPLTIVLRAAMPGTR